MDPVEYPSLNRIDRHTVGYLKADLDAGSISYPDLGTSIVQFCLGISEDVHTFKRAQRPFSICSCMLGLNFLLHIPGPGFCYKLC